MTDQDSDLDVQIQTAVQRFQDRLLDLKRCSTTDASQIETIFLASFTDGNPDRATELVTLSKSVADLIREFDRRTISMLNAVGSILFRKDLLAHAAIARASYESGEVGKTLVSELNKMSDIFAKIRAHEDPGPIPEFSSLRKIRDTQASIEALKVKTFQAGATVAATIDMMADIVELRVEYLHKFKLANLPLNPQETLERIQHRFKSAPDSTARRAALALIKGTMVAVVSTVVENNLPWSTMVDLFERLQIVLVGERISLEPGPADALLNMRRELSAHLEALEVLFEDCKSTEGELDRLASALLRPTDSDQMP